MAAWHYAQSPGQRLRATLRLGLLTLLLTIYICLSAFARLPGPIPTGDSTPPAAQALIVGLQMEAVDDDRLTSTRWLKDLLACNLVPAKPKYKALAHLQAGGSTFVYAGIRASACIPADRVRQTTVRPSHGYRHRAPPACA